MILRYPPSLVLHTVVLLLLLAAAAQADTSHIYLPSTPPPTSTPNITSRQRAAASRPEYVPHPAHDLLCRPFGECEPCPKDELDQPFCFPFGNRRLLHCLPADQVHEGDGSDGGDSRQPAGEVPAWESCGKVIRQERQEYQEFVIANLLFLIVALGILWGRSSALAAAQYRQLAARIGIPGSSWRT